MNKVSVEISANVNEYVQGMNQASESTQKYESDMRKVSDYTVSFNRKLRESKKEVKDLAITYAMLDKETKNSDFGKRIKQQLEAAKKEAAEFIDMQGDIQRELKELSSDTRTLDTLSDAIGGIGEVASTAAGGIALITGNTEDAQRAVVMFTTAQSALAAATKITNLLQKEGNIMRTVTAIQSKAAAAATNLQTSATVGATAAQKAFNLVAKANPYVLLTTAIIGVTAAVAGFIAATRDEESEQQKVMRLERESAAQQNQISEQGRRNAQDEVTKLDVLYKAATSNILSMEERRKAAQKLIDQHPAYMKGLSAEEVALGKASAAYKQLREDIIAAAMAKAYMENISDQANLITKAEIDNQNLQVQLDQVNQRLKEYDKRHGGNGPNSYNPGGPGNSGRDKLLAEQANLTNQIVKNNKDIVTHKKNINYLETQAVKNQKEVNKLLEDQAKSSGGRSGRGSGGGSGSNQLTPAEGSIAAMNKEISQLKQFLEYGLIDEDNIQAALDKIKELEEKIKKKKIRLGWEIDTGAGAMERAQRDLQEAFERANKNNSKIKLTPELSDFDKAIGKNPFEDNLGGMEKLMNWNQTLIEQLKQQALLYAALGEAGMMAFAGIAQKINLAIENQQEYGQIAAELKSEEDARAKAAEDESKRNEELAKQRDLYSAIGSTMNDVASSIASVAQAAGDSTLETAMKILALAVSKVFEGFSYASSDAAKKLGFWGWAAFSAGALAQTIAMVAQMKSAAKFAEGGVVPGNSYSGDRVMAYVNSGEVILNKRQQANALALMDANSVQNKVYVTGKIRGTDLLLVQKNTNKALSKAGSSINIG